jgi:hypothetical protein
LTPIAAASSFVKFVMCAHLGAHQHHEALTAEAIPTPFPPSTTSMSSPIALDHLKRLRARIHRDAPGGWPNGQVPSPFLLPSSPYPLPPPAYDARNVCISGETLTRHGGVQERRNGPHHMTGFRRSAPELPLQRLFIPGLETAQALVTATICCQPPSAPAPRRGGSRPHRATTRS